VTGLEVILFRIGFAVNLLPRVRAIGVGNIGYGMGYNLLTAGFKVVAYDICSEPLVALWEEGGIIAPKRWFLLTDRPSLPLSRRRTAW